MRIHWLPIFMLCIIALIVFLIIGSGPKQRASISFDPSATPVIITRIPTPSPISQISTQKIEPGSDLPTPNALTNLATETIALSTDVAARRPLSVSISDAFGDPIRSGTLRIGDGTPSLFLRGRLSLQPPTKESFLLVAEADGYRSASQTVEAASTEAAFTLEYLSSYEVTVYASEKMKNPVPGAKVILWKDNQPPRPIQTAVTVTSGKGGLGVPVILQAKDDGVAVLEAPYNPDLGVIDLPPVPNEQRNTPINQGNLILGLGGCKWCPDDQMRYISSPGMLMPNSSRLRMWDTLALCRRTGPPEGQRSQKRVRIEFENSISRVYGTIWIPNPSDHREVILTGITDEHGQCRFERLLPGMYYAQAQVEGRRTELAPLYPACGGAKLHLEQDSEVCVMVRRKSQNMESPHRKAIAETSVTLKPMNGSDEKRILAIGKTNRSGEASFKSIPFGEYQLSVNPPDSTNFPSRREEITIEDTRHNFLVEYDVGVSVHGKVLEDTTKEPIAGYVMNLYSSEQDSTKGMIGIDKTDSSGRFVFRNLMPDTYMLYGQGDGINLKTGYSGRPYYEFLIPSGNESDGVAGYEKSRYLIVEQEDIHGIIYYVTATQETRISGIVTRPDGAPVEGALVTTRNSAIEQKRQTSPSPRTKQDGRFVMTFELSPGFVCPIHVYAEIADHNPPYWKKIGDGGTLAEGETIVHAQGQSEDLTLAYGKSISDLHIIMEDLPRCTIEGTIQTEDGVIPEEVHIQLRQFGALVRGEVFDDGRYRIENASPGKANIACEVPFFWGEVAEFGEAMLREYSSEYTNIEIPDDVETFQHDIFLRNPGFWPDLLSMQIIIRLKEL